MKKRKLPKLITASLIKHSGLATLMMIAGHGNVAVADQVTATTLEEIVVTARKRAENLQETPIAITAFSNQVLETANLKELSSIEGMTPNLNFSVGQSGGSSALQAFIRGVGEIDYLLTTDPTVGLYVDGVYVARTAGADIGLAGVEQIEVLRGPQGTLFGKNTIGGAINVTMKKPSEDAGFLVDAGFGNYGTVDTKVYATAPLIEGKLAANISLSYRQSDGWQKRPTGGNGGEEDRLAVRAGFLWTPTENFESLLSLDAVEQDQASYTNIILDVNPGGFVQSVYTASGQQPPCCFENSATKSGATSPIAQDDVSSFGVTWTNTFDMNAVTVKSITAYRDMDADFGNDYDHSAAEFYSFGDETSQEQISQELQFLGSAMDDRLEWVVGLYYFNEDGSDQSTLLLVPELVANGAFPFDLNLVSQTEQETTSKAAFAHLNYDFSEQFSLSLGARYTKEDKKLDKATMRAVVDAPQFPEFTPTFSDSCTDTGSAEQGSPFSCEDEWDDFSPKVSMKYQATENLMFYGSASKGFRSGGFNGRATDLNLVSTYEPEKMKGYELGLKSDLLDSRARVNLALFKNDYTDKQQQVNVSDASTGTNFFTMNNAGEVELQGVELEVTYLPVENWIVNFNLGYLDAEYTKYEDAVEGDLSFRELPHAPELTYGLYSEYTINLSNGGELILQGDLSYKDDVYLDVENSEALHADDFTLYNASVRYRTPGRHWEFALSGRNLTDEEALVSGFDGANFFGVVHGNFTAPARYLFSVRYINL